MLRRPLAGALLLLALTSLPTLPAHADPADGSSVSPMVQADGGCTGPSTWVLVGKHVDGTLRIRYVIRGGKEGQKWNVFLSDNGTGFFAHARTSHAGGKVVVTTETPDLTGKDKISAGANNVPTGESCGGHIAL